MAIIESRLTHPELLHIALVCLVGPRKNPANSLSYLVNIVEKHIACLNKTKITTAVDDILPRAQHV